MDLIIKRWFELYKKGSKKVLILPTTGEKEFKPPYEASELNQNEKVMLMITEQQDTLQFIDRNIGMIKWHKKEGKNEHKFSLPDRSPLYTHCNFVIKSDKPEDNIIDIRLFVGAYFTSLSKEELSNFTYKTPIIKSFTPLSEIAIKIVTKEPDESLEMCCDVILTNRILWEDKYYDYKGYYNAVVYDFDTYIIFIYFTVALKLKSFKQFFKEVFCEEILNPNSEYFNKYDINKYTMNDDPEMCQNYDKQLEMRIKKIINKDFENEFEEKMYEKVSNDYIEYMKKEMEITTYERLE